MAKKMATTEQARRATELACTEELAVLATALTMALIRANQVRLAQHAELITAIVINDVDIAKDEN